MHCLNDDGNLKSNDLHHNEVLSAKKRSQQKWKLLNTHFWLPTSTEHSRSDHRQNIGNQHAPQLRKILLCQFKRSQRWFADDLLCRQDFGRMAYWKKCCYYERKVWWSGISCSEHVRIIHWCQSCSNYCRRWQQSVDDQSRQGHVVIVYEEARLLLQWRASLFNSKKWLNMLEKTEPVVWMARKAKPVKTDWENVFTQSQGTFELRYLDDEHKRWNSRTCCMLWIKNCSQSVPGKAWAFEGKQGDCARLLHYFCFGDNQQGVGQVYREQVDKSGVGRRGPTCVHWADQEGIKERWEDFHEFQHSGARNKGANRQRLREVQLVCERRGADECKALSGLW